MAKSLYNELWVTGWEGYEEKYFFVSQMNQFWRISFNHFQRIKEFATPHPDDSCHVKVSSMKEHHVDPKQK